MPRGRMCLLGVAPETQGMDGAKWKVWTGEEWKKQRDVLVVAVCAPLSMKVVELESKAERALALSEGRSLTISGASGPNRDYVNGEYRLTPAVSDGFAVYEKTKDPSKSIWHIAEESTWMVGDTDQLGRNNGYAELISVGVAPETQGMDGAKWKVYTTGGVEGAAGRPSTVKESNNEVVPVLSSDQT